MKRAVAIIAGVGLVCLVAYLSWLNPAAVEFRLSPERRLQAPLAALLVFAFVCGAVLVLAVVLVQAGQRAFAAWRQGRVQRWSERIDDWQERGEQLVWQGELEQGRALLQKAWHRRPETAHAVLALARSYHDTGELQRARRLLTEAATQHHTNADVLLELAEAHRAAGDRTACIEVLERLRALHPRVPRVLRALRDRYTEDGRWREAAAIQETLLVELRDLEEAAPERDLLAALRYQAAIHLPDAAARVHALEGLADSRAGSAPVLVSLGDALRAGGHEDEASVLWERALRSTPRTVFVERLAAIATEPRHRERLRTLLRKVRADGPQADNVHLLTAALHLQDGNTDAAARELEAVQHPQTAPPLLHYLRAEVYRRRDPLETTAPAPPPIEALPLLYRCRACSRTAATWAGYCPCGAADSYRADVEIAPA